MNGMQKGMLCALSVLVMIVAPGSRADITKGDPAYEKELLQTLDGKVSSLQQAKSQGAKLELLKQLKAWLAKEAAKARAALEKAEAKGAADQKTEADRRDTEALRLQFTFEPVFREILSLRFKAEKIYRENTCLGLPGVIEFESLVGKPDGTPLPPYGERAQAVIKEFCPAGAPATAASPSSASQVVAPSPLPEHK